MQLKKLVDAVGLLPIDFYRIKMAFYDHDVKCRQNSVLVLQ